MIKVKSFTLIKGDMFSDVDKLLIYKDTLEQLSTLHNIGICTNMQFSILDIFGNTSQWDLVTDSLHPRNKSKYEELYIHKPKGMRKFGHWFPLDKDGQRERIKIINMIINTLEDNIIRDYSNIIT